MLFMNRVSLIMCIRLIALIFLVISTIKISSPEYIQYRWCLPLPDNCMIILLLIITMMILFHDDEDDVDNVCLFTLNGMYAQCTSWPQRVFLSICPIWPFILSANPPCRLFYILTLIWPPSNCWKGRLFWIWMIDWIMFRQPPCHFSYIFNLILWILQFSIYHSTYQFIYHLSFIWLTTYHL